MIGIKEVKILLFVQITLFIFSNKTLPGFRVGERLEKYLNDLTSRAKNYLMR